MLSHKTGSLGNYRWTLVVKSLCSNLVSRPSRLSSLYQNVFVLEYKPFLCNWKGLRLLFTKGVRTLSDSGISPFPVSNGEFHTRHETFYWNSDFSFQRYYGTVTRLK